MSSQNTDDDTTLERTIGFMTSSSGCFHATHYHSFQSVFFHFPFRSCEGCGKRLQLFGRNQTSQVVQCRACGAFAHRACGFSKTLKWKGLCQINYQSVQEIENKTETQAGRKVHDGSDEGNARARLSFMMTTRQVERGLDEAVVNDENDGGAESSDNPQRQNRASIFRQPLSNDVVEAPHVRQVLKTAASEDGILHGGRYVGKANFPFLSSTRLLPSFKHQEQEWSKRNDSLLRKSRTWVEDEVDYRETSEVFQASIEDVQVRHGEEPTEKSIDASLEWTKDGPPLHWASREMLETLPSKQDRGDESEDAGASPVYFASHTFSNVSRALHEHIIAHFQPVVEKYYLTKDEDRGQNDNQGSSTHPQGVESTPNDSYRTQYKNLSRTASVESETPSEAEVEALLEEKLDKESSNKRLGLVTVAGGVVGGIAGFMIAGPVGWVIGGKMGQTAGILGVVLEGSVGIGVFASGIAAGRHAGQQLQDKIEENRILALGDGTKQSLLLVRPNVTVDSEWADIYAQARKSHPADLAFNIFPSGTKAAKRERYEREFDIVKTDEEELATEDKVLLLVSRQLNNRDSLPGHVYRELLRTFRERSDVRGSLPQSFAESNGVVQKSSERNEDDDGQVSELDDAMQLRRSRRQDAHAVIKYVTATLLEVRPGFSISPGITELTATAVESLVFGEVYDLIIGEIEADYKSKDETLLAKIEVFESQQMALEDEGIHCNSNVSESAISALHHLPEAHSVADKLQYCTIFLERISDFFAEPSKDGKVSGKSMGADSLLKMVCQHLLLAKVPSINAQVAFIEEFARDEQLIHGKEGYSLVTLQASLHFLNRSEDLISDIFDQEDDF